MKNLISFRLFKQAFMLSILTVATALVWAQDSTVTAITTTTAKSETQTWYTEPWVWAVGAGVLILLIVALVKANNGGDSSTTSRTDKVTVTKTTEVE